MRSNEIILNGVAQDKIEVTEVWKWFESKNSGEQFIILSKLVDFVSQSHPSAEIIQKTIDTIPIKPTMTPVVLLEKKELKIALREILQLPESEYIKSFKTLLHLFRLGDKERRKLFCRNICTHEWHNIDDIIFEKIPLTTTKSHGRNNQNR